MPNARTDLHCKTVEAAAQLLQLAIEDAETVERLMIDIAARMARESAALAEATGAAHTSSETAAARAQHVRRIAALMIESAHGLAAIGGTTRARFSHLLTERLASGSHEQLDAYQAFFSVLPGRSSAAVEALQAEWNRSDRALDSALRLAMPPSCVLGAPPAPAPAFSPSAASGP